MLYAMYMSGNKLVKTRQKGNIIVTPFEDGVRDH